MSVVELKRVALVFPGVTDEVSTALTCTADPSEGTEVQFLSIENPLAAGEAPQSFGFDDVVLPYCPNAGALLSHCDANEPTERLLVPGRHTRCVLIHGSVSSLALRRLFKDAVDGVVTQVMEAVRAHEAASAVASFSVVRAYSWGATDALKRTVVESNLSPAHLSTPCEQSTVTLTGSEYTDISGASSVLYRRLHPESFERKERPLLHRVLGDALRVPDGHSAVKFSLVVYNKDLDSTHTFTVGLLPQLKRANHLFCDDLLNLRSVLQEDGTLSDPSQTGRLARLFMDVSPGASNRVCVLTAVDGSTPYAEANLLQCWYGSAITCEPTPLWTPIPSSSRRTGGVINACASASGNVTTAERSPASTVKQLFPAHLSESPFADIPFRGLQDTSIGSLQSNPPTPSSAGAPLERKAFPQLSNECLHPDLPPSQALFPSSSTVQNGAPSSKGLTTSEVTGEVADLKREKLALEKDKANLQEDIRALEAYKAELECSIGEFFMSIGQGVMQELEDAETAMLNEVNRAQTLLGVSRATGLAQEQQLLSRLSVLVSEVDTHRVQSGRREKSHSLRR